MKRDYEKAADFTGCHDGDVGVITIPEKYIPKKPNIVDLEKEDVVKENNPDDKKLHVRMLANIIFIFLHFKWLSSKVPKYAF